jgi:hypothetical protein
MAAVRCLASAWSEPHMGLWTTAEHVIAARISENKTQYFQ